MYGSTFSPLCDVLEHKNHIFSESLSSGDDNDQDKDMQKDKCIDKDTNTDKYKSASKTQCRP